ncbi:MAG: glycosyltransferase family 9 protein, partial [Enterovibrio sp.]
MPLFTQAPAAICVLRLSAIGDVCNAIAAVQAIEKHWPSTHITWIAGKAEAALLTPLLPKVRVIAFDKNQGVAGMRAIWQALCDTHFDALLHMQTALRASLLSFGIKARYRLGFAKDRSSDLQRFFVNHCVPSPNSLHVLDGFMAFAHELGVPQAPPNWDIHLNDVDIAWAKQQLSGK